MTKHCTLVVGQTAIARTESEFRIGVSGQDEILNRWGDRCQ
jgi:hypothetical protein